MKITYTFTIDEAAIEEAYVKALESGLTTDQIASVLISTVWQSSEDNKNAAIDNIKRIVENLRNEGYESKFYLAKEMAKSTLASVVSNGMDDIMLRGQ